MCSSVVSVFVAVVVVLYIGDKHLASARDVPYTVELKNFELLKDYDTNWVDWDTIRMTKVSRNRIGVSDSVKINRNMGNEQKVSLKVFSYDSERDQRGPVVFDLTKGICDFIKEDEDIYPGLVEKSDVPADPGCPFPQGTYTFKNYEIDATFLPDDSPKGDYLVEVFFKDGERNVAGLIVYVTLS